MASFVVSFFLLVSLISSDAATPPTGVKVRITENAKDVLKLLALTYLKGLLNKPFEVDFSLKLSGRAACAIKKLTLTELQVDPAQVEFRFQDNNGLRFEIKELNFAVELQREIIVCLIKDWSIDQRSATVRGAGVSATIVVRLNRLSEGGLRVEIPNDDCRINADNIRITSAGILGPVWDLFNPSDESFKSKVSKICPALQPVINEKLKDLPMQWNVHEDRQLNLDYSLSRDIAVTPRSLDVSFKGLVLVQGQDVETGAVWEDEDIILTETDHMIYAGFSEFFFNGAAMALYRSGPFHFDISQVESVFVKGLLKVLGFPPRPLKIELTEAPTIKISTAGLSARGAVEIHSEGRLLPLACQMDVKVDIINNKLVPVLKQPKCSTKSKNIIDKMLAAADKLIFHFLNKWFDGIPLPLPVDLNIIEAKVQYEDGNLVAEGNLNFDPLHASSSTG